jgi:selenocysteine lyase/cysteine desulfurase
MTPAEIRDLFPGLRDTIYLNTATMCMGSVPVREAYSRATERWVAGRFDWIDAEEAGEAARQAFAELINATAQEIALIPSVSTAAGLIATNLPPAKRGDNLLVTEDDFTSNLFPWLLLKERGYEVRMVPGATAGPPVEAYAARADAGTRLIAVSAVHSLTGYRIDLQALSRVAARSGAWLFVDACQAAGAVPLDVRRDGIDFLSAASHKFLLGSRGMGYLFIRQGLLPQLRPIGPGWRAGRKPMESFYGPNMDLSPNASRFDSSLAWFPAMAEQGAIEIFRRVGRAVILERNARLIEHLHQALAAHGLSAFSFPPAARSTIASVQVKDADAALKRLQAADVIATVRGGRVRLAPHFYNLESELEKVAALLASE